MDFLRPGTRVWIGEDLLTPAMIVVVHIVRDLTCHYTVEYWRDGFLQCVDLERFQFSTEKGIANENHQPIEIVETQDAV
ncbi:MAG: hypothetical protein ACLP9L_04760 [Thermoguttaceae bacterium]